MSNPRDSLQKLVHRWEEESRKDSRDHYPYQTLLDELLFHSDVRFKDYKQFQTEGEFPARLKHWLGNYTDDKRKKVMFQMLRWMTFIDRAQMLSLYRDAYRRTIVPWLTVDLLSAEDLLSPNYEIDVLTLLRQYQFLSITESFDFPDFSHINDLRGLAKPHILGEEISKMRASDLRASAKGAIILEDFVGTGKQAGTVIGKLRELAPPDWRILFIPLIALEEGATTLERALRPIDITSGPTLIVPKTSCIKETPGENEPSEFARIRTLIKRSAGRVLERYEPHDDPPSDAFGYKGCGSLLVTCNNAPNNSLPLLHHRAPDWNPLFRRVHHSKDYL